MRSKFKIFLAVLTLLVPSACGDYLDKNIDPYRVQAVTLDALLPTVLEATSNNHYLVAVTTGLFTQHLASHFVGGTDSYQETRMATAWTGIYVNALSNLDLLVTQAQLQNSPHYAGIGKILQALNLGLATDAWGDVPFSTASKGEGDLTPSFDNQENVYATINQLLDESIVMLNEATSLYKPATDDIVYGGNISRWRKLAYTLKARYAIHLSDKSPAIAAQTAIDALASGMTALDDDFQLVYNSVNRNPWFNNVSSPISTGNLTVGPSEQIVSLMNGTFYPIDPRLSKLFDKGADAANYTGMVNGQGGGGNARLTVNTWYASQSAPMLMVTLAERHFILAEAHFIKGEKDNAYQAYLLGIAAHMARLGIAPASITAYTSDPGVAVGSANLTLELIMKEKYIALYLNPEAWVDVRRYKYDPNIYRGMAKPANYNDALGGEFIRRVLYPNEEINRNGVEANAHVQPMQAKMWWEN